MWFQWQLPCQHYRDSHEQSYSRVESLRTTACEQTAAWGGGGLGPIQCLLWVLFASKIYISSLTLHPLFCGSWDVLRSSCPWQWFSGPGLKFATWQRRVCCPNIQWQQMWWGTGTAKEPWQSHSKSSNALSGSSGKPSCSCTCSSLYWCFKWCPSQLILGRMMVPQEQKAVIVIPWWRVLPEKCLILRAMVFGCDRRVIFTVCYWHSHC